MKDHKERFGTLFSNKYEQIRLLGEGSYGKAFLVECIEDKSLAVIKSIDLVKNEDKDDALQEGKILEKLEHPNIIRFREIIVEKKQNKKSVLYIVMDYADGGDLNQRIKNQKGKLLPENQIIDWFTQVCLALKHIHDRKILHRDIKSQNVFLTKNGLVKLGDFGIAKCLDKTIDKCKTMVGTPYYLSPEIINNHPYDFKSDIWALGVLLYEMCTLKVPFDAPSLPQLSMKIINGNYNPLPPIYSKELRDLVNEMLSVNSFKRPGINGILKNRIIKSRIKNFLSEVDFNKEFSHTILHKFNVFKKEEFNTLDNNNNNIAQSQNDNRNMKERNFQRPVIKKDEKVLITSSNSNSKQKNYHFRDNKDRDRDKDKDRDREKDKEKEDKETIQSKDDTLFQLKSNLIGNPIMQKNLYQELYNNNNLNIKDSIGNINSNNNNNHNNPRSRPESEKKESSSQLKKHQKSEKSEKGGIKKENSERMLSKKSIDNEVLQTEGSSQGHNKKQSDRSDSHGSKEEITNLRDFKRKMKEKLSKNPNEDSVIWMKGMKERIESLAEKEYQEAQIKARKNEREDLNDFINLQKMLLEYEEIQQDNPEEYSIENMNDEQYINNDIAQNANRQLTEPIIVDEKVIEDQLKYEIESELGKEILSSISNILKENIRDDMLHFDNEELNEKIRKSINHMPLGYIERAILKVPEIYFLILRKRV